MWSGRKEQESQARLEKKESERKKRVSRRRWRRRRRHSPRPLASVRASRSLCPSFGCFHGRHLVGSFTPRGARARKSAGARRRGGRRQRGQRLLRAPRGTEREGAGRSGGMGSARKRELKRDSEGLGATRTTRPERGDGRVPEGEANVRARTGVRSATDSAAEARIHAPTLMELRDRGAIAFCGLFPSFLALLIDFPARESRGALEEHRGRRRPGGSRRKVGGWVRRALEEARRSARLGPVPHSGRGCARSGHASLSRRFTSKRNRPPFVVAAVGHRFIRQQLAFATATFADFQRVVGIPGQRRNYLRRK